METDGRFVGGAAINPTQFAPASLLWRTPTGQVAWISVSPVKNNFTVLTNGRQHYVSSSSISARANEQNLTIAYPPSRAFPDTFSPSNVLSLLVSGIPGFPLDQGFGSEGTMELPGILLTFSGNLATRAQRSLVYGATMLNDLVFYNLTYMIPGDLGEVPELVISFEKL